MARAERYVAVCRRTRMFLGFDCCHMTERRLWAWSGTAQQARRMREVYPLSEGLEIVPDTYRDNSRVSSCATVDQ